MTETYTKGDRVRYRNRLARVDLTLPSGRMRLEYLEGEWEFEWVDPSPLIRKVGDRG